MKSLVLAEKPSVAKEIARVLGCSQKQKHHFEGPAYVVTWALGHLVTLAEPEDYNPSYKEWRLEDLPLIPERMKLKVIRETTPQFKAISALAKRNDLKELIIATDAGREGELVARWIMELVQWRKPFKRLWISSQTDKAIRDGFASLKPGRDYDRLYRSAVCRAEADWLIGLNLTRALTCKHGAQLAAGRVQTPTLAALMDREKQIQSFQSKDYWQLRCDFGSFQGQWRSAAIPDGRLFDKTAAETLVAKLERSGPAQVAQLKQTEKQEPHPLAYDLTELQRDANKRYGFTAKQTSNVLQRLYEQYKLVTYPRTDSRYLSTDIVPTLAGRLRALQLPPYASLIKPLLVKPLPVTKRIADDSKVTDHHAIIPTDERPALHLLSADERKLYDLIVKRFLALFYPPYRYDETTVMVQLGGESFHAKGRVVREQGWRQLYEEAVWSEASDDDTDGPSAESGGAAQALPPLTQGQKLDTHRLSLHKQMTRPPGRFTEASLLTVMEKHGLGTPATRADIIEKLLQTDTIERRMNTLQPTGKGAQLINLVSPDLRSSELTAAWEQELQRISTGQGNADAFMSRIRKQTETIVREVKVSSAEYKPHNLTGSRCPECGNQLQEIKGKQGKRLLCSNRECSYRRASEAPLLNKRCPQCRKKMELHEGKAGKYAQCKPCNVIEMLGDTPGGKGGRSAKRQQAQLAEQYSDKASLGSSAKRQQAQLAEQYSDKASLGSSLEEALRAAMEKKK